MDRIELRTTREEKQLLAAAAAHEHLDLTGFILRNSLPAAQQVVEEASRIMLSARDSARVLELLENPPEPTDRLLRAAAAYRARGSAAQEPVSAARKGRRGAASKRRTRR